MSVHSISSGPLSAAFFALLLVCSPFAQAKYSAGSDQIGRFESRFGYRLDLRASDWRHWQNAEQDIWYPDLAGELGGHSVFVSVPACYPQGLPADDALSFALLRTLGLNYPDSGYRQLGAVEVDGQAGELLGYTRQLDNGTKLNYRLYLFKRQHCAQLLALWSSRDDDKALDFMAQGLLAQLEFSAVPNASNSPHSNSAQAWFHNSAGLYFHQAENFLAALESFRHAALIDPSDLTYITNAASVYNRLAQYQAGLNFLDQPALAQQDAPVLSTWRGWYQFKQQNFAAAAQSYKKAFDQKVYAEQTPSEDDLIAYASSLLYLNEPESAQQLLAQHVQERPSVELVRTQAKIAAAQQDYQAALAILDAGAEQHPRALGLALERMDVLGAMRRYEEIIELCQSMIRSGNASAVIYHYLGDAQYQLERYLQAKESFEIALQLAPNDVTIAEYLRFTDAQLGKGDSSSISVEIEPVEWPELAVPDEVTGAEDYDSHYLQYLVAYHFDPKRPLKTTRAQIIKVRDQAGVRRFSTLFAEFNPLSEKLYVNRLLVRDAKGRLVSELERSNLYIGNSEDYDQATFGKVVRAPVAGLAPGYTIEFVYTTEKLSVDESFPFERLYLSGSRPIGVSALYLEGELDSLLHNQSNARAPKRGRNSLFWVAENPPISQREPMQVDPAEYLASVALVSKDKWRAAGEDYRDRVADLINAESPELKPLVEQLTGSLPHRDEAARIAALASYVQSTLTYKALEFGVRGYTPNTPTQILADRFGDCKDHSVLLWRLLRAADIPAELALANLSGPVDPELPSIDQFDHMVVYLPKFRGGAFIDATNKDLNLLGYTPSSLGGSWTLTLGENPDLVKVPEHSASEIRVQRHVALQPEGDLMIDEQVRLSAYFGSSLRAHFKDIESRERLNWAQRFLGANGEQVLVQSLLIDNVFEPNEDLVINLRYRLTPLSWIAQSSAILDPSYWERYYLSANLVHERQTDFEVAYPLIFDTRVSYSAPHLEQTDWQLARDVQEQSEFGKFESEWRTEGARPERRFRYEMTAGRYSADAYARFQNFSAQALEALQQPVRLIDAPLTLDAAHR